MNTFTLWLIIWMTNGQVAVVESMQFQRELSCKQAAVYAANTPIEGARKIDAVCKKTTDV